DDAGLGALIKRYALPPTDEQRLIAYLRERAEGNPFFAGELLRTLTETGMLAATAAGGTLAALDRVPVPALLAQVITGRVARLGGVAARLLPVAAVVGAAAPLVIWQAVAATDEESLLAVVEGATEAGLLVATPDGAQARFAHALIREALYESVIPARRRGWHRRIAEALLATPAPDPDAVAYHFQRAGDERAGEWLVRAGERAQRAYAWLTAADRFEAALIMTEGQATITGERGWLLLRLSRLRRYADPRQGIAYLDEAGPVAVETGDRVLAAYVRYSRGLLYCFVGDIQRGLAELEAGCAALDALGPSDRQRLQAVSSIVGMTPGHHRGTLAHWLAESGHLAEARTQAEPIAAHAAPPVVRGLGGSGYGDACNGLGTALAALGQPAEARRAFAQARQAYLAVDHYALAGNCAWLDLYRVLLPYQSDQRAERQRLADEAEYAWRQARGVQGDQDARFAQLPIFVLEGQWAEARTMTETVAATEMNNGLVVVARLFLGSLARAQGDTALAWAQVRLHLPLGPATAPGNDYFQDSIILQRLAAALATDAGDLPLAREWLAAHDRWLAWSGAVLGQAEGQLGWAEYYRAAGDHAQAWHHAEAALARATEPRQPLALLAAHRLLGELDTAAGGYAVAQTHLTEALALADACAAPYERALCLLAQVELRAATGDRDGAQAALAEARTILEPLGAKPALARADALDARLAAKTPSTTQASAPNGLS
ncbi:MAG: hypothetical protein ACTHMA_18895, partial [Thermomicrobiales bacterium]